MNLRKLLEPVARVLTSPAVVTAAAALATAGAMILSSAVEGARRELMELDAQYTARDNELKEVLELLHRAVGAERVDEKLAVLVDAGPRYPAPVDVDPLDRAEATA
jgi:hypothetical protein